MALREPHILQDGGERAGSNNGNNGRCAAAQRGPTVGAASSNLVGATSQA